MTDEISWTVAFAGNGETPTENATALLDDWLPLEGVSLLFPKLPRAAKTLRAVHKWAKDEELSIAEETDKLVERLVTLRDLGEDVYLVLAWDDTDASSKLLEQANEAGIQVKDLTRALDDLEFEDDEPAGEPAATESDTDVVSVDTTEADPPWDTSEDATDGSVPDSGPSLPDIVTDIVEGSEDIVSIFTTGPAVIKQPVSPPLWNTMASYIETWVREIMRDEYDKIMQAKATAPDKDVLVPVLVDADGNYRLGGRGRPRKGETATTLTRAEAIAVGIDPDE